MQKLLPPLLALLLPLTGFAQDTQIYNSEAPEPVLIWHRVGDVSHGLQSVEAAEFSPDGSLAVSGGKFGYRVMLWRVADGVLLWEAAHESEVECVTFSPDGKRIATGGEDYFIRVWDVATGEQLHAMEMIEAGFDGITWSPDGKHIVGGDEAGNAVFFDATTYAEIDRINCGSTINSLDFTADGTHLLVGGNIQTPDPDGPGGKRYTGFAKIIDMASKEVILDVGEQPGSIKSVRYSADEQQFATGGFDNKARIFNATTGELVRELTNPLKIEAVAFTPDGQYLATGGHEQAVSFYRLSDGGLALKLPMARVEYLDFTQNGRMMLTGHEDSGLLSCYLLQSNTQARGNYQQIADKQLNNRDLKKN
jgi:WD40 repeat protein